MSSRTILRALFAVLLLIGVFRTAFSSSALPIPRHPVRPPKGGTFPDEWVNGTDCANESRLQVHAYNDDFYILRQSKCVHFEAPFLYLIFGQERVLLIDTGSAAHIPLRPNVDRIIDDWTARNGVDSIELVVAHTHNHFDHIAGDSQFDDRPNTTVVGIWLGNVQSFFGITDWPEQIVTYDLGERVLDIIPIPGHRGNDIAFYDPVTQILISGDTLYPGFLFIFSPMRWDDYQASVERLVRFGNVNPICWVLGGHVEMTDTPGVAYPYGSGPQPDERELQLTHRHLLQLHETLLRLGPDAQHVVFDDFILSPMWVPQ